jgi:hypothetical protein
MIAAYTSAKPWVGQNVLQEVGGLFLVVSMGYTALLGCMLLHSLRECEKKSGGDGGSHSTSGHFTLPAKEADSNSILVIRRKHHCAAFGLAMLQGALALLLAWLFGSDATFSQHWFTLVFLVIMSALSP